MKCDNCKKEELWLNSIGTEFICKKCIQKHKIMGLIFRTQTDVFKGLLKRLKIKNYEEMMNLERKQIESTTNLRKFGIKLKTTNVVEL